MSKKKVTWNDVGAFVRGSTTCNIIKRSANAHSYRSRPNGRSSFDIDCPFCGETIEVYVWSFTACGKNCSCGAMLAGSGDAYHFKELTMELK